MRRLLLLVLVGLLASSAPAWAQMSNGTNNVKQGAAASLSGAWPVKPTDGTTAITVKAASTSPALADPAEVVAVSPNPAPVCTSVVAISQTTSTQLVTGTASQFLYICSLVLISATAQNLSLVEGTGTVCATGVAALVGGTTASVAVAANGGFSSVAGSPWLKTQTAADNLCLLQSGTGNVSGVLTYVSRP